MEKDVNRITRGSSWSRFNRAPIILRAYIVFAILASLLAMSPIFSSSLFAVIVPYAGWSGFTVYMSTLVIATKASLTRRRRVYSVVSLLVLGVVIEIIDTVRQSLVPFPDSGNPYLAYSPYRPFVTIVLPVMWMMLLMSPFMRKWINDPVTKSESTT